jgi:hypothetical protein
MNIYQRLNKVRETVAYLQKTKEVQGQGYKAIQHDEVTSAVRQPFIDNGIVTVPEQTDSSFVDVGKTKNGATIIRYSGWYNVHFVNADDPQDKATVRAEAHAMDHGDKAPGKAMSYAVKYAMLKLLNIETGEDEESRIEIAKKAEKIPAEKAKHLEDEIANAGSDVAKVQAYFGKAIEDLTENEYQSALTFLAKRKK